MTVFVAGGSGTIGMGGYLARASDPPPGNMVMWRGLARLTDIVIGFEMAKTCG